MTFFDYLTTWGLSQGYTWGHPTDTDAPPLDPWLMPAGDVLSMISMIFKADLVFDKNWKKWIQRKLKSKLDKVPVNVEVAW